MVGRIICHLTSAPAIPSHFHLAAAIQDIAHEAPFMRPPTCSVSGLLSLKPLEGVSQTHPEVVALEADCLRKVNPGQKIV